ncbi:DegV family protein [Tissierella praeacuta]|uniref:DegV family protein n=1 Tax=Tissierella praeacuta TaxID=43131 RepID=UPI0033405D00
MSKIKIITDSTSYITKEYAKEENVTVVPLSYIFGEESGKDPFPGEFDEFYNKLQNTKLFPSTSQPPVGEFLNAFNNAFEEGYDEIIAILLSSKLSGTFNSAMLAKNMLENKKITIIDSQMAVANLKFLVEDAVQMVKEGKSSREIESYLNTKKVNMNIYLTTDTLEYLSRGGRLSAVQATLGNFLNIKPIIQLKDGELKLLEKLRGRNKVLSAIMERLPSNVEKIGICHVLNKEDAEKIKDLLQEKFPKATIIIDELGPVIGSHLGPKGIGVCFY